MMRTWVMVMAVLGLQAGCDDDPETEEASLGADACEHLEQGPIKSVTAGAAAASAADASGEHTRWDVTFVDVTGGKGGFLSMALEDAGEHVLFFTDDVELTITDSSGAEVTTTKVTSDADCADVGAAFTVDFSVGTYTLDIAAVGTATSVSFVLIPAEGEHEH